MKTFNTFLFLSLFSFLTSVSAQQKFKCAAGGEVVENVLSMSATEIESIGMVEDHFYLNVLAQKISTELLGLPETQPIKVVPASNVNNFQAESAASAFIIYYNPRFVSNLKEMTNTTKWYATNSGSKPSLENMKSKQNQFISQYKSSGIKHFYNEKFTWIITGILVHEMGHILRGHNFYLGMKPHERELEADQLTGEILKRLNASKEDATRWLKVLPESETESHPARRVREIAINSGWDKYEVESSVVFRDLKIQHNVKGPSGENGMVFKLDFSAYKLKSTNLKIVAYLHDENKEAIYNEKNSKYRAINSQVCTSYSKSGDINTVKPSYDSSKFTEHELFIPYDSMGIPMSGTHNLNVKFNIFYDWWGKKSQNQTIIHFQYPSTKSFFQDENFRSSTRYSGLPIWHINPCPGSKVCRQISCPGHYQKNG
ncbi:MAG: hypothetical protein IPL65_05030 [Lewinellaceae bacterium]|nr:hypothetical protein [Lewinellaceae bacterium]